MSVAPKHQETKTMIRHLRSIEAMEKACAGVRDRRQAAVKRALDRLRPAELEQLISAFGAEREDRVLSGDESAAKQAYTKALSKECRRAGQPIAVGLEGELSMIDAIKTASLRALSDSESELAQRAWEAADEGRTATQDESAALQKCNAEYARLERLAGMRAPERAARLSTKTPHTLTEIRSYNTGRKRNRMDRLFPATGILCRENYPKHMEFFEVGKKWKERLFMAANPIGKTTAGAYETTLHLTGLYPDWWKGYRFDHPTEGWACGTTSETTRDIVQRELLGPESEEGTGMIPGDLILHTTPRPHGMPGSKESIWVQHVSGGKSKIGLKTYEQGRKTFEGTTKDWIWCDEEPPEPCYTEMKLRTMTTRGIIYTTFTPLQGMSAVVKSFLEPENAKAGDYMYYVQAGWAHAPHLDEAEKENLLSTTPRYQLRARTLGEPTLGAGAIYPIAEEDIIYPLMAIPANWPRVFGLDVGWKRTAAIWAARNPGSGVIVLYDEHYQAQGEAPTHAAGIKARGAWIPGVIDPAARGRSQVDGRRLLEIYRELGLKLSPADNAVESGLNETWTLLVSGLLKVTPNCHNWLSEFRKYHRDEKGNVVEESDHLMDATRYLVMSGRDRMIIKPMLNIIPRSSGPSGGDRSWMGG
jgi:phage terminase large subunit-like protein